MTSAPLGRFDRLRPLLFGPGMRAFAARGFSMVAAFAMTVTIARTLPDKETTGLVYLVYTLIVVASNIGRLGTDNLALREVARGSDRSAWVVRHTARTILIVSPLAMVILVFAIWLRSGTTFGLVLGLVAASAVIPFGLSILAGGTLRGLGMTAAGTFAELGSAPAFATCGMLILYLSGIESAMLHVVMIVCGYTITMIWSWILVARSLPDVRHKAADFSGFVRTFGGSLLGFFTASLGFLLFAWLPIIVLGYFSTNDQVANYNAGARIATFVALIPTIQVSYLSQQFAKLFHEKELDKVNAIAQRATWQAIASAGLLATPLVIFPEYVLRLFGSTYHDAAPVLQILAIGAFLVAALGPVNGLMLTVNQERAAGRITTALVVTSLIALPLLAPYGAAVVALAAQIISLSYALACTYVLAKHSLFAIFTPRTH